MPALPNSETWKSKHRKILTAFWRSTWKRQFWLQKRRCLTSKKQEARSSMFLQSLRIFAATVSFGWYQGRDFKLFQDLFSYGISKAALDQFSLIISGNYAPDGIRVNSVNPAQVATEFMSTMGVPEEMMPILIEAEAAKQPLAGFLSAEEVAQSIWMCCDPALPSMTGQKIVLHGGRVEDKPWENILKPILQ